MAQIHHHALNDIDFLTHGYRAPCKGFPNAPELILGD